MQVNAQKPYKRSIFKNVSGTMFTVMLSTNVIHLHRQALFSFLCMFARLSSKQVTRSKVCSESGTLNR